MILPEHTRHILNRRGKLMRKYWIWLPMALLLVFSVAAIQGDESPEVQLRAAMHMELVEGDLSGAIELYQKIASNPNAPRATIARALLQIGLCYEKLGDAQARPSYQKLIEGYPEQLREVEAAKQRLAEMAQMSTETGGTPTFQHIQMTARLYMPASLSPRGDRLAFPADLSLWIMPVHGKANPEIAGVPERLTGQMGVFGQLASSGDGNWIAFNAMPKADFFNPDVYFVSSAGGEPTRAVTNRFPGIPRAEIGDLLGISLSPDGKKLAYIAGPSKQERMYVIPIAGGEAVALSVSQARQPAFSPDGKWIACVTESRIQRFEDGEPKSTVRGALWVASSNGTDAIMLIEAPGYINTPIWSPDGRMIAYLYNDGTTRSTRDLRIIPIRKDGRPAASPSKLELPFVASQLVGWTARNEIGILKPVPSTSGIYRVAVTGGRAALIRAGEGNLPRWSPDGSRIYFEYQGRIAWIAPEGGEPSDVTFRIAEVVEDYGGSNEPSLDGSRLVFAGYLKRPGEESVNIWTVPSNGGEPRQITDFRSPAVARFPCWSPDGKVIAFVKADPGQAPAMYLTPAEGGESRAVTGVGVARIAWSPNGTDIAYFSNATLNLFNLRSGESRILVELQKYPGGLKPPPNLDNEMAWSPDGKQLAYTHNGTIWLVPLNNPLPARLETGRAELRASHLDWSPDSKWLVFKGVTGSDFQLDLMTDFMPLVTR
jgi:Tol biopolymer transport system component